MPVLSVSATWLHPHIHNHDGPGSFFRMSVYQGRQQLEQLASLPLHAFGHDQSTTHMHTLSLPFTIVTNTHTLPPPHIHQQQTKQATRSSPSIRRPPPSTWPPSRSRRAEVRLLHCHMLHVGWMLLAYRYGCTSSQLGNRQTHRHTDPHKPIHKTPGSASPHEPPRLAVQFQVRFRRCVYMYVYVPAGSQWAAVFWCLLPLCAHIQDTLTHTHAYHPHRTTRTSRALRLSASSTWSTCSRHLDCWMG